MAVSARHRPNLILISAGFDAHVEDPLAELELVEDDYRSRSQPVPHRFLRQKKDTHSLAVILPGFGYHADLPSSITPRTSATGRRPLPLHCAMISSTASPGGRANWHRDHSGAGCHPDVI